jgi:hypothetical protein
MVLGKKSTLSLKISACYLLIILRNNFKTVFQYLEQSEQAQISFLTIISDLPGEILHFT